MRCVGRERTSVYALTHGFSDPTFSKLLAMWTFILLLSVGATCVHAPNAAPPELAGVLRYNPTAGNMKGNA